MAASDATYRNMKTLHVIFGVTSLIMLATIVGMFADDYYRDWKVEQRLFRDVEEEMAKRAVLAVAPSEEQVGQVRELEESVRTKREAVAAAKVEVEKRTGDLPARKMKAENRLAGVKAEYDSTMSLINLATEQSEAGLQSREAQKLRARLDKLGPEMARLQAEVQANQEEYDRAAREAGLPKKEKELADEEKVHKEKLADFDRFLKLTTQKRWRSWKEGFLTLPVIEGFASPTRIQQYTLNDLPIDYSFKMVTRYDRCTTCHQGMEKGAYTPADLAKLADDPGLDKELQSRFRGAETVLQARIDAGVKDLPRPQDIRPRQIPADKLTPGRVMEFAAHPRLDLFVDANSPHNAEKFGCTICHGGQGSATSFTEATHYPNDTATVERWGSKYGWHPSHDWDYPMVSHRFTESSCVKCHHEITDMIREGNRIEAPKLVNGYNIVRDLGCFGCHEIPGMKGGRKLGPDLRLEPDPPLDARSPAERANALADPLSPPGEMRKVGPNLMRVSEKTNESWVRQWLKSPRGFRENTKMPHFYNQPNNRPETLPDDQKAFPDNEIHAIAHYLINKSEQHIGELKKYHTEKPEVTRADAKQAADLTKQISDAEKVLSDPKTKDMDAARAKVESLKKELTAVEAKIGYRNKILAMAPPVTQQALPAASDAKRGRMLFQERGCMACHVHEATEKPGEAVDGKKTPPIIGDATFGPELSRVALKLMPQGGTAEDGRRWLVGWLLDPPAHSPRTLMPIVHLTLEQAGDIASWLLSQRPEWKVTDEEQVGAADSKTLQDMAQVYLKKVLTLSEVHEVLETKKGFTVGRLKQFAKDADELELGGDTGGKKDDEIIPIDDHRLKMYVGKKAIGNLGCYACHTIPGFQNAKPIGTALNEWGKKDPDRLAFEDAENFVKNHFNVVPSRDDAKDRTKAAPDFKVSDGKKPYEKYFEEMLDHHHRTREGFLHLKLEEPRSFDYNRIKTWDDRLRMPQFKFARPKREPGESRQQFESRTIREEAEAREAAMTFILGLTAESVPPRYTPNPTGDRLDEARGRKVLDKFNCAGCHIVRPGVFDFKPDYKRLEGMPETVLYKHEAPYTKDDYFYPDDIAWAGREQASSTRFSVKGVAPPTEVKFEDDEEASKDVRTWLLQALRFHQNGLKDGNLRDVPASATLFVAPDAVLTPPVPQGQYGGRFTEQLAQYLQRKDRENYAGASKLSNAYASAPPLLAGEGQKVQPDWLYRFLLNPYAIRPLTVLRMPKFNMSPEEAQQLVNYFNAADRTQNIGIGLTYPYVPIPQKDDSYLKQRTAEYVARLKANNQYDARKKDLQSFWEESLGRQKAEADRKLKDAEDRLKATPDAGKAEATKARDEAKKLADEAEGRVKSKDVSDFVRNWETREAYLADASRLVTHGNICLTCHHAGGVDGKENKGPNLDNVAERIRPDWAQRWITNPNRFLHYVSVMPINFKSQVLENQDAFVGTSLDQIQAARDFLMLYPQVREWPILRARPQLGLTPAAPAAAAAGGK